MIKDVEIGVKYKDNFVKIEKRSKNLAPTRFTNLT